MRQTKHLFDHYLELHAIINHLSTEALGDIAELAVMEELDTRVAFTRLQTLTVHVLPKSPCGFRDGRSTIEMIFSTLQRQEKCEERYFPLYIEFVNKTKVI